MQFTLGDWMVDPDRDRLLSHGNGGPEEPVERKVDHKAMRVLVELINAPRREMSRDEILEKVWSGTAVTPQVVTVAVSGIRKALGDSARRPLYIQTVPGHGYRLVASAGRMPVQAGRTVRVGRRALDWARTHPIAVFFLAAALLLLRALLFPHPH